MWSRIGVCCVAVIVSGCASVREQPLRFPDFSRHAEVFEGVETGVVGPRYVVVGDDETWARLWNEHDPGSAPPAIDFDTSLMVCVFEPEWTEGGFCIDRIVRGSALGARYSFQVDLRTIERPIRYAMVRVDRTRFDFRFYAQRVYAQGELPPALDGYMVAPRYLVARRDVASDHAPPASLRQLVQGMFQDSETASDEKLRAITEELAALGDAARPLLHEGMAGGRHSRCASLALHEMNEEEIAARGRAVLLWDVAIEKAMREVCDRGHGNPFYLEEYARQRDGHWYILLRGTWRVFSYRISESEAKDVRARMIMRANDGAIVFCDIQPDTGSIDAFGEETVPASVLDDDAAN